MKAPTSQRCPMCDVVVSGSWDHNGTPCRAAVIVEYDLALAFVRDDRIDGYSYVIPKRHVPFVTELDDQEAAAVMVLVARLTRALDAELAPAGLSIYQNNGVQAFQTVPHVHFHVAPRRPDWHGGFDPWSGQIAPFDDRAQLAARLAHWLDSN